MRSSNSLSRSSASLTLFAACVAFFGCADGSPPTGDVGTRRDANLAFADAPGVVLIDAATRCGDETIQSPEECEGANLNGQSCESLGYAGGTLSCASCAFDKSLCTEARCGNGIVDSGEACDGATLMGATCTSRGFTGGELRCSTTCTLDESACTSCGNGTIETGEECDQSALNGATCISRGFASGTLSCSPTCGFNVGACVEAGCGNGVLDAGEDCDASLFGGATCASRGYASGSLSCSAACTFNTMGCTSCGDGNVDGGESCDGGDLAGQSCTTRGFTMGTLACTPTCQFETSGCATAVCGNGVIDVGEACDDGNASLMDGCASCTVSSGYRCTGAPSVCTTVCGDGLIAGGEQCDSANLAGQSCLTRGFTGGALTCNPTSCAFVTTACTTVSCGNGSVEAGEECDDGNTTGNDGCMATCQIDRNFYLPLRLRDGDGSNHGRLEVNFAGSWRDVCDDTSGAAAQQAMANVVCRQLGYTGTGHAFINAFGGGTSTPLMDDVECLGPETDLSQCAFAGWNVENCGPSEAVGIRCMPGEGDIRLVSGPSGMEGRLQVFHAGSWGEVCDDYLDGFYGHNYTVQTACQQLGYRDGEFLSTYDAPSSVFSLDDVACSGTERRIDTCPHLAWGTHNCSATEGAGLRCSIYGEGQARLAQGTARNNGRVEVLHSNVWGSVCDDGIQFDATLASRFAQVTCRELRYIPTSGTSSGTTLLTEAVVDGTDPIWLDDVVCGGAETTLPMCMSLGWATHNCSHYEDIGLSCVP